MSKNYFKIVFAVLFLSVSVVVSADEPKSADHHSMQSHKSLPSADKINIAVFLYEGALLLDYGIAAEMFLAADFPNSFSVYTIGRERDLDLSIVGGVKTDYLLADAPRPDVIIIPGGPTLMQEGELKETQEYLKKANEDGAILFSICSGSVLLAKLGLLDGRNVTTVHLAIPMLKKITPTANVIDDQNFVDDGDIVTSKGSGTAIEATLHLIERLKGKEIAEDLKTRYMNYPH